MEGKKSIILFTITRYTVVYMSFIKDGKKKYLLQLFYYFGKANISIKF